MPSDHSEEEFGNHIHSGIIQKTGQKNVVSTDYTTKTDACSFTVLHCSTEKVIFRLSRQYTDSAHRFKISLEQTVFSCNKHSSRQGSCS